MFIKTLDDVSGSRAGDASFLKELLNPAREPLSLRCSLAHAEVSPGAATLPHRLQASEVYYILEGRGRMHVGGEAAEVAAGQAVYIPPGETQFIENTGASRLAFLCLVDPAWTPAGEEVL
ncbi:MAG: cupin domain-containing protein [Acidobacteriota bacterium]